MKNIKLGKTDINVTPLATGTCAWGNQFYWSYGKGFGAEDLEKAFKASLEAGITFFDTAEFYGSGESESLLGQFMKQATQPVCIATKYAPFPWRIRTNAIHKAITRSLQRLQLESIPLYQVHWPWTLMSQERLMNALADEVQRGRIQSVGVSNYSAAQMRHAHDILARRGIPLAVNQIQYSLLDRRAETNGLIETARELGVTILCHSALAQGLLTGKYRPETAKNIQDGRRFDPRFRRKNLEKIVPLLNGLDQLGEKYQKTPSQIALNWLIAQGGMIPIAGAKNAQQVIQNVGALGWSLSQEDMDFLNRLSN